MPFSEFILVFVTQTRKYLLQKCNGVQKAKN